MEPSPRIEVGPVIHTWGPFRVRSQTQLTRDGLRMPMPTHVVSILLGPEDEFQFVNLSRSADALPDLVVVLQQRLRVYARNIAIWEKHLEELQQPERRAALQAQLDEEARTHNLDASQDAQSGGEVAPSVAQVIEGQEDELWHIKRVYEAIQAGILELEIKFPELNSDTS